MGSPQDSPGTAAVSPWEMVELRFLVPREWRDELDGICHERAISKADLLRQMVREFMRNRRDG